LVYINTEDANEQINQLRKLVLAGTEDEHILMRTPHINVVGDTSRGSFDSARKKAGAELSMTADKNFATRIDQPYQCSFAS
jgi:hypothetical protein